MHAGIIEYDDRKGLRRLLLKQKIKGLNDHRCRHGFSGRVINQFSVATKKTQHIKASAMGESWQLQRPPCGTPAIRHRGCLRKARLIEIVQLDLFAIFPLLQLLQQALSVAKIGFVPSFFQGSTSSFETIPQLFLKPA